MGRRGESDFFLGGGKGKGLAVRGKEGKERRMGVGRGREMLDGRRRGVRGGRYGDMGGEGKCNWRGGDRRRGTGKGVAVRGKDGNEKGVNGERKGVKGYTGREDILREGVTVMGEEERKYEKRGWRGE